MTKQELKQIAEDLIEELREMPDGTETSAVQLLELYGYDPKDLEDSDIIDFHMVLRAAARANHITLKLLTDKRGEVGMILPSDLRYAVHNERARIRCPRCGSGNTARILYGMPAFSGELQAKLDSGKVTLGGCCISCADDGRGNTVRTDPARRCNDCGKSFARLPYLVAKDHRKAEAFGDIVTGIRFMYTQFYPRIVIEILKTRDGANVSVMRFPETDESISRDISGRKWKRLVDRLYTELYVQDWKREYERRECVLDGFHWSLEILMTNRRKRTYRGSNAYPPYWEELAALFRPYAKLPEREEI